MKKLVQQGIEINKADILKYEKGKNLARFLQSLQFTKDKLGKMK